MNEQQHSIQKHIEKKKVQLDEVKCFWEAFLELNDSLHFSDNTFNDVRTRISNKMAQIDISIRDHEKLLKLKS